jgi:methyl-accepting chemotaxis protein
VLLKKLADLSIAQQVMLAFAGVVITIAAATTWTERGISSAVVHNDELADGAALLTQTAAVDRAAKDSAIAAMMLLVVSDADQQQRVIKELQAKTSEVDNGLKGIEQASSENADLKELVAEVRKRQKNYLGGVNRIVGMVQAGKQAEAAFAADEEMLPMVAPFMASLTKLEKNIHTSVQETEWANKHLLQSTRLVALAAGGLALLMAGLAGWLLARSLTKPLAVALQHANHVANGDFSQRVMASGRNEAAQLLQALDRISVSLSSVVSNVRQNSETVATASAQIAQGNLDLSQRTEEQASALQQTTASIEQLSVSMRQNLENARQANQLASGAASVAVRGGDEVAKVVDTMRGINDSSKKITDIISVIDGIAFQTNILALNAAVEAARAGEQGRGFAVVASEVRMLAGRSAGAAREIKQLIAASVERVEQGSRLVDQAGNTMTEVVGAIQQVTELMQSISAASEEQTTGAAHVSTAVSQMDQTTQQNAALVEESASAAASLQAQADQLVTSVAVFRLADSQALA